jgi:hypothetical protein
VREEVVMMLIGWHEGTRQIVFFGPDGKPYAGFRAEDLRKLRTRDTPNGWKGEDGDYRFALPRIDKSPLALRHGN